MRLPKNIDILENYLRRKGKLLDILLLDHTTKRNIIWATDSYVHLSEDYAPEKQILPDLVTGKYGKLIQPRASKSREEQRRRTKEKGEVFTPLEIVDKINRGINKSIAINSEEAEDWKRYVNEPILEIACGEAPFIASRYDPSKQARKVRDLDKRVGFLDKKLKVVSSHCSGKRSWLHWARQAYKASYGYEWQGDNILIARENLLYTMIDYYRAKFGHKPSLYIQEQFAEIISRNIFQMDGIKYVIPLSCRPEKKVIRGTQGLFEQTADKVEERECEGCKFNRPDRHNGTYAKIMNWAEGKPVRFLHCSN